MNTTAVTDVTGLQQALVNNATYEYFARLGVQSDTTAGLQYAVQCTVAGATIEGHIVGTQSLPVTRSIRTLAQGALSANMLIISGDGYVEMVGIITAPATGSPYLTIQAKKVTSGNGAVYPNSYTKLTRIS
jgi:hypothetical protein